MKRRRIIGLIVVILTIFILKILNNELFHKGLEIVSGLAAKNYLLAVSLYILLTALSCVFLALPGFTFAVAAGVLFEPFIGSIYCLIGTTIGAVLSFIAGRYFLKDSIEPLIKSNKLLNTLIFSGKNEVMLLMITRLLPIFPFNLQNFAYGITDMGILKYSMGTMIFMVPGVVAFTYGSAGIIGGNDRRKIIYVAVSAAFSMFVLTIFVKRKLKNGT